MDHEFSTIHQREFRSTGKHLTYRNYEPQTKDDTHMASTPLYILAGIFIPISGNIYNDNDLGCSSFTCPKAKN